MKPRDGFNVPNTTQTPDALFDLMPGLGDPELRVTLHLVRQTLGWRREWSDPDYSTIPAITRATGLSEEGVRRGIRAGIARGTVERAAAPTTRSFTYRLTIKPSDDQGAGRVNAVEGQRARGSTRLGVNRVDPQPRGGSEGQPRRGSIKGINTHKKHPHTTGSPKGSEERATRTRKRTATGAATGAARPRNDRFDAFCVAWAIDPDNPGGDAGLAQRFATRTAKEGATIDEFRVFYREQKASGAWGEYVQPHNCATRFLAWRRRKGKQRDPFDAAVPDAGLSHDPPGAPPNWRDLAYFDHNGRQRVRMPVILLPMIGLPKDTPPASWPAWLLEVYRGTDCDPARAQ